MKFRPYLALHLLYLVIALLVLAGQLLENMHIEYAVKPLIMPLLAVLFLLTRHKRSWTVAVLLAFFFSWWGDNFLMFSAKGETWFFAGVGSFFVSQCVYVFVFARRSEYGGMGLLGRKPWWILPFVAYLAALLLLLLPGIEGLLKVIIPVYGLSLLAMSALALHRRYRVNLKSFRLVFIGSLFFVLSDSMIAVNRFHTDLPKAGFWIMLTYMIAQYLIMRGLADEG